MMTEKVRCPTGTDTSVPWNCFAEDVSQSVFASYLNVTKDSVSKWERGEKKPAGPSLKLLSLVERKGLDGIA